MNSKIYRYITFDLDTNYLNDKLGDYTKAYKIIKDYMINNNFSHRQGSAYISNQPLSFMKLTNIILKLFEKHKILEKGCRKIDGLDVGDNYDLKLLITDIKKDRNKNNIKNKDIER